MLKLLQQWVILFEAEGPDFLVLTCREHYLLTVHGHEKDICDSAGVRLVSHHYGVGEHDLEVAQAVGWVESRSKDRVWYFVEAADAVYLLVAGELVYAFHGVEVNDEHIVMVWNTDNCLLATYFGLGCWY